MVKVGLGLVGRFGEAADRDLVMRLGLLEELTLYSLVALQNLLPDAEPAIFDLAQQVDGWGRVHAIRRLTATKDPAIRRWLRRGGADIPILIMEVAYIAATTGGLVDALRGEVDDVLLDQAGLILATLAEDGPAEGMADYDDAPEAVSLYLRHLATAPSTLEHIGRVLTLRDYIGDGEAVEWDPALREEVRQAAGQWLSRPDCASAIEYGLRSEDFMRVRYAISLAPELEIDPRGTIDQWLNDRPHDFFLWYSLLQATRTEDLAGLVERARAELPLEQLAGGAESHLGVGPDHDADSSLGAIVGRLSETPGLGWALIDVALRNRVIRNRNMAVRTLSRWPHDAWPPQARDALAAAMFREPNANTRGRMRELLETGTISEP